mmetsp:Transcript_1265/g.3142  ORF Transcript_1265/g.3142 Transcript_1265/m.3142 type:complete len:852 (+) Transcript_1265:260-2815(+)
MPAAVWFFVRFVPSHLPSFSRRARFTDTVESNRIESNRFFRIRSPGGVPLPSIAFLGLSFFFLHNGFSGIGRHRRRRVIVFVDGKTLRRGRACSGGRRLRRNVRHGKRSFHGWSPKIVTGRRNEGIRIRKKILVRVFLQRAAAGQQVIHQDQERQEDRDDDRADDDRIGTRFLLVAEFFGRLLGSPEVVVVPGRERGKTGAVATGDRCAAALVETQQTALGRLALHEFRVAKGVALALVRGAVQELDGAHVGVLLDRAFSAAAASRVRGHRRGTLATAHLRGIDDVVRAIGALRFRPGGDALGEFPAGGAVAVSDELVRGGRIVSVGTQRAGRIRVGTTAHVRKGGDLFEVGRIGRALVPSQKRNEIVETPAGKDVRNDLVGLGRRPAVRTEGALVLGGVVGAPAVPLVFLQGGATRIRQVAVVDRHELDDLSTGRVRVEREAQQRDVAIGVTRVVRTVVGAQRARGGGGGATAEEILALDEPDPFAVALVGGLVTEVVAELPAGVAKGCHQFRVRRVLPAGTELAGRLRLGSPHTTAKAGLGLEDAAVFHDELSGFRNDAERSQIAAGGVFVVGDDQVGDDGIRIRNLDGPVGTHRTGGGRTLAPAIVVEPLVVDDPGHVALIGGYEVQVGFELAAGHAELVDELVGVCRGRSVRAKRAGPDRLPVRFRVAAAVSGFHLHKLAGSEIGIARVVKGVKIGKLLAGRRKGVPEKLVKGNLAVGIREVVGVVVAHVALGLDTGTTAKGVGAENGANAFGFAQILRKIPQIGIQFAAGVRERSHRVEIHGSRSPGTEGALAQRTGRGPGAPAKVLVGLDQGTDVVGRFDGFVGKVEDLFAGWIRVVTDCQERND